MSRGDIAVKGKGKVPCWWVNETAHSGAGVADAVERVRARQKERHRARILQANQEEGRSPATQTWRMLPEQAPSNVTTTAKSIMRAEDLDELGGKLHSRLAGKTTRTAKF